MVQCRDVCLLNVSSFLALQHPVLFVQLLSHVQLFATPWTVARQTSLSFTISQNLLKLTSIVSMTPSNHLILCHPLLFLPSIFPSIRVFSTESVLRIRGFSFSINSFNEYSGLISFTIEWFDLLAIQETQESSPTPQFKSINSSALSLLYRPTLISIHDHWKNHSFDCTHICPKSDVSAFVYAV